MTKNRSQWGSSFGVILATVGAAIGLGTIWRFPYLASKYGGGVFLLTYLVVCLTLGFILVVMELCLGRTAKTSAVGAFSAVAKHKGWQAIGILNTAAVWMVSWFYYIIGGWVLFYIVKIIDGTIPIGENVKPAVFEGIFSTFVANPVEPLFYCAVCLSLTLLILLGGVKNGIEKFSKILLPIRLILMLVLIARAVTFPGGWEGVEYFLIPDFSKLTMAMLLEALGLGFFTLSLAMGIVLTYGSYTPNKVNLFNSAKWTALLTVFACFLAGLVVLPTVFAFGFDPAAGPGLVFMVMPAIFGHMPLGLLFAVLFFVILYLAAQLSAVAIAEAITSFFIDEFHMKRRYAVLATAAAIFPMCIPVSLSLGIWSGADYQLFGKTIFDLADYVAFSIMLPVGGILLSIFTGWVAWDKLESNLIGEGSRPIWLPIFKNTLRFVMPLLILVILIQSNWPIF